MIWKARIGILHFLIRSLESIRVPWLNPKSTFHLSPYQILKNSNKFELYSPQESIRIAFPQSFRSILKTIYQMRPAIQSIFLMEEIEVQCFPLLFSYRFYSLYILTNYLYSNFRSENIWIISLQSSFGIWIWLQKTVISYFQIFSSYTNAYINWRNRVLIWWILTKYNWSNETRF